MPTPERKDYCGPYWMPSFMRKWLSSKFNASCKIHDRDYEKGIPQEKADFRFIQHLYRQSKGRFFWEVVACIFFLMVRAGGKISWKKAQEESKDSNSN